MARGETYDEFVEKFKPKKTTDDCYTPALVYEKVLNFVREEYGGVIDGKNILRPFFPGGDYEAVNYNGGAVVDNPPFSILKKITEFYKKENIKCFLFAPALTVLGSVDLSYYCVIFTGESIIYENGAAVATAFITNLEPAGIRLISDGRLVTKSTCKRKKLEYPANIKNSARMHSLARKNNLKFNAEDYERCKKLPGGSLIYGGGIKIKNKKEEILNV